MFRLLPLLGMLLVSSVTLAQTREEKVRNDKKNVEAAGIWIYNDLPKAFDEAKKSNKPIMAVLRCLPCEECVKLDDEILDADERIKPLLDKFVRVRVVSTNGLDLSLFQFDTDQSFAVFFLHQDGTIFGRFGTRSHRKNWVGDVSVDGLAVAMKNVIAMHDKYPTYKDSLAGKRGAKPEFARPELLPSLKGKYTSSLDYQGKVVASCIHCHQIGEAVRDLSFSRKERIPEETLFPYPHPKTIGLTLDPKQAAVVLTVEPNSAAATAGLKEKDTIYTMNDQPLISIADVQWVLHNIPASGGEVKLEVGRGPMTARVKLTLKVAEGWRTKDDISWRSSTWNLRRKALGGFFAVEVAEDERANLKIPADVQALLVQHVGQYAPHDVALRAGIRKGDVVIGFDGRTDFRRETDLIAYSLQKKTAGDKVTIDLLREGKKLSIPLTLP